MADKMKKRGLRINADKAPSGDENSRVMGRMGRVIKHTPNVARVGNKKAIKR